MSVFIEGADFGDLADFFSVRFPEAIKLAQVNAVNDAARYGLKIATEEMLKEVRFPAGYLDQPKRFYVSQFAQDTLIEAKVTARSRPTSLLQFAVGNPTPSDTRGRRGQFGPGAGVRVEINPGQIQQLPGAFVIALKNGNYGVAVKIKKGVPFKLKSKKFYSAAQLSHDYYILYGPSVDQVFQTVRKDVAERVRLHLGERFRAELEAQERK